MYDRWDAMCDMTKSISTTGNAPDGFLHAWYSELAHETLLSPTPAYYRRANGTLAKVSEVSNKPYPSSRWEDLRYIGLVKCGCVTPSTDPLDMHYPYNDSDYTEEYQ